MTERNWYQEWQFSDEGSGYLDHLKDQIARFFGMFLPNYSGEDLLGGGAKVLFRLPLAADHRLEPGHRVDYVVPAGEVNPIFLLSVGRLQIVTPEQEAVVIGRNLSSLSMKYVVAFWKVLPELLKHLALLRSETIELAITQYRTVMTDASN